VTDVQGRGLRLRRERRDRGYRNEHRELQNETSNEADTVRGEPRCAV
jgi:hypothetical protein